MNTSPLVSVCIASYNHERFIAEAVSSVIAQSYSAWELVVVDDASTDGSAEILQAIAAQYPDQIRLVLLEENTGPSGALNRAILEAKGEYVALLGSDDRMHRDRLKKQVDYLNENPGVSTVFTRVAGIDAAGRRIDASVEIFDKPITDIRNQLLQGNFLSAPSVMGRRDVWLETGLHNAALRYVQDYDLWLRILDHHEIARLDDRLTEYRIHGDNLSIHTSRDVAFACHYETAICKLNAIQRWSLESVYSIPPGLEGKARESAVLAARVAMARLCLKIDQTHFQRPFLGTAQAYRFALEAVQMAPGENIVQDLLGEVYSALGDELRATGNGELKLHERWNGKGNSPAEVISGQSGGVPQTSETTTVPERNNESDRFNAEVCHKTREAHALQAYDIALFENRMRTKWSKCPSVQFVLMDVHADEKPVIDSVGSVIAQLYSGWGLSVISGRQAIAAEFESEPNMEWITTDCLEKELVKLVRESSADWVVFLYAGDRIEPHYLASMLDLADINPGAEVIYSDADTVNDAGEYFDAQFRPDADLDRLRSSDYIGHGCLLKTETVIKNVGLVSLAYYSFVYGILLKIIEDGGENAFAHDTAILFHTYEENASLGSLPVSIDQRKDYLESHLERCGLRSHIIEGYKPGVFYVEYLHDAAPFVSIIIPTKDKLEILEPCVSSLLGKTRYRNFEVIIVDNNSDKSETLEYFDKIQSDDSRVRVVRYPKPYNYSAINNMAAKQAKGDYLVLLNNDTEVIKEDWLDRMLSHGLREDVGIVGARLLHPDSTIQHAGVVVGMSGVADHSHIGADSESPGYLGQNLTVRGVSAVTAACLLIRKDLFFSVKGLDEEDFSVLFNDVDLCLKVRKTGLRVVYTPYAVLIHHGSFSLKKKVNKPEDTKRRRHEHLALIWKWLPVLANDPAYNRNLCLYSRDVSPDDRFVPGWDMHRHDSLRLVTFPADDWRGDRFSIKPLLSRLQENNSLRCMHISGDSDAGKRVLEPVEVERGKPDVLLFHTSMPDSYLIALEYYAVFNKSAFKVLVLDDPQCLPSGKRKKRGKQGNEKEQRIRKALASCDRLLVPTRQLARAWSDFIDDIKVVPGNDEMWGWEDLPSHERQQHLDAWLAALTPPVNMSVETGVETDEPLGTEVIHPEADMQNTQASYPKWMEAHRLQERDIQHLVRRMMSGWSLHPSIHLITTHVTGQEEALADTLDSLGAQLYSGWGLSIVSHSPCPDPVFEGMEMLEWCQVEGDLMDGVNVVARASGADWLGLLEAGTLFEPHMLYQHIEHLHQHPELRLVYMDEDRIDDKGERYDPLFKPECNLELLRAMPYMGTFVLIEREALHAAGGYGLQTGAETSDAVFRVIEQCGEQAVGHIADVLIHRQDRFQLALDQDLVATNRSASVTAHLKRCGIHGEAKPGALPGSCFVDYACHEKPVVEIIVPVAGKPETLELFMDSLLSKTQYPEFRVRLLVRDGVEIPAAVHSRDNVDIASYPKSGVQWQEVFKLAGNSDTEYLVLMSPGAIAIQPNWLERLVAHFQKPDVAVVAPRLVSADKTVAGGGIITGAGSSSVGAGAFDGLSLEDPGYMGRAQVAQELSAVPVNCILVRKSVFGTIEGLSDSLRLAFHQAVDFCLRVRETGGKIIWTPHSTLMFIGEAQPELDGLDLKELLVRDSGTLCRNSLAELANDPAYNPNLRLNGEPFSVDDSFTPPSSSHDPVLSHIIGFGVGSYGSWQYRVVQPLDALQKGGVARCIHVPFSARNQVPLPTPAELERVQPDVLLMHNTLHDNYIKAIAQYKKLNDAFIVFGQDDLMSALPPSNPFAKTIYKDVKKRIRKCLSMVDRLVVTTEPLAQGLRGMVDDIVVVPNYIDETVWGSLQSQRGVSAKPRVGWAGAQQHLGDLQLLEAVVRETASEVDWVFFGMCPDFLMPFVKEVHDPVLFESYPEKLATLNLDLAVAPLERNKFNESKSNLRLLEYGILGWPVIASDIEPYRNAPVCRVTNQARAWINAIRERINDLDAVHREGDMLRNWVHENWILQDHANIWLDALKPLPGASNCKNANRLTASL